jgi:heme/copper-type cytochrome/quinol oxidase subunit 3
VTLAEGIGEGIGDAETIAFKTLMFGNHFFVGEAYPWLTRTRQRGLKGESHVFMLTFFVEFRSAENRKKLMP